MITVDQAKMEFSKFVNSHDPSVGLYEIYQSFVAEKMKLDKYFSDFLEENELVMSQDNEYEGEAWQTYKSKLKEYDAVDTSLRRVKYYINKDVR